MAIVRLTVLCPALPPPAPLSAGLLIRSYGLQGDPELVHQLASAVTKDGGGPVGGGAGGPTPGAAGLVAELASRPDRRVEAWLALASSNPSARPLGLVTLVTGGRSTPVRHSISWLIVDPQARRRGLGRHLVEAACRHAWQRAATRVSVECRSDWYTAIAFWRAIGFDDHPLV